MSSVPQSVKSNRKDKTLRNACIPVFPSQYIVMMNSVGFIFHNTTSIISL
jgi:hypothetical protein